MIDRLSIPLGAVDCSRVNEEDGHPVSHADELNPPFAVDAPVSRRPQVVQLGRDCGVSGRITGVEACGFESRSGHPGEPPTLDRSSGHPACHLRAIPSSRRSPTNRLPRGFPTENTQGTTKGRGHENAITNGCHGHLGRRRWRRRHHRDGLDSRGAGRALRAEIDLGYAASGEQMTMEQVRTLVPALHDIASVLASADPKLKVEIYSELAVSVAYDQEQRVVSVQTRPKSVPRGGRRRCRPPGRIEPERRHAAVRRRSGSRRGAAAYGPNSRGGPDPTGLGLLRSLAPCSGSTPTLVAGGGRRGRQWQAEWCSSPRAVGWARTRPGRDDRTDRPRRRGATAALRPPPPEPPPRRPSPSPPTCRSRSHWHLLAGCRPAARRCGRRPVAGLVACQPSTRRHSSLPEVSRPQGSPGWIPDCYQRSSTRAR